LITLPVLNIRVWIATSDPQSPAKFRECFMSWTQAVRQEAAEIIAVDGKTARGSRARASGSNPLRMVTAWACENRLVLAQETTDEKSFEINAILKLLALLKLKGCIVTLDAMGCQRAIAEQIRFQQGDYAMGLKGNQSHLHEAVDDDFTTTQQQGFKAVPYSYAEAIDQDHGRLEIRCYWITEDLSTLPDAATWAGLRSISMAEREWPRHDALHPTPLYQPV